MPTALIVSRSFPPIGSTGASIRLVKFMKYIAALNWEFTVITQHPEHQVVPEDHLSATLEKEIPPDTKIIRVQAPSSLFPGISLWWGLRVFWQGWRESKRQKIDLIFVVTPPFSSALIGYLISNVTRKPLVLDIKDDWVGSPDFGKKPAWRKAIETQLENIFIQHAKAVNVVTEHSYHLYQDRYAKIGKSNKIHYIPNGCDLDEYSSLRNRETPDSTNHFVILSAAWGFQKNYRDITPFFLALEQFFHRYPQAKQHVEVILLGNSLSEEYDDFLLQTGIKPLIKVKGSVEREQLVEWLWKADLFLSVQPVGNTTAIPGTLYEYWATGKAPILLIASKGASSEFIDNYHLGNSYQ
jgi:glycosyltransferase involved in cell wall biosynthesis